jgi:hypothetical protein
VRRGGAEQGTGHRQRREPLYSIHLIVSLKICGFILVIRIPCGGTDVIQLTFDASVNMVFHISMRFSGVNFCGAKFLLIAAAG